jgi:hypothetical protein
VRETKGKGNWKQYAIKKYQSGMENMESFTKKLSATGILKVGSIRFLLLKLKDGKKY